MKTLKIFKIFFVASMILTALNAQADSDFLVDQIRAGGYILMIRHATAPGTGDPANFQIGDCSTQRNLDNRGRAQARAIGEWLRSSGIEKARLYSSQWCRCLETAKLINLGPVTPLPALNSFFDRPQDREPNLKALRSFLSKQTADSELLILITHYVTISAITGEAVSSGEGVILRVKDKGTYDVVGKLGFGF